MEISNQARKLRLLKKVKKVVVKVGSSVIASPNYGLTEKRIESLVRDLSAVHKNGYEAILVSSGAIAAGMSRLGLSRKPKSIPEKQAAAAIGQSSLMWVYEKYFGFNNLKVAQILLTQEDISDRRRYLNARNTIFTILKYGVIPIINENDSVAIEEIKVGDNDNLSALVANLIEADLLIILTDIEGLYSADPRKDKSAYLIKYIDAITPEMESPSWKESSPTGIGGMATKIQAAQKVISSGVAMVIASGFHDGVIAKILKGEETGSFFFPREDKLASKKRWIAFAVPVHGILRVDHGARTAIINRGKSLLPSGIISVEGDFSSGDLVAIADSDGCEFARGLISYDTQDVRLILGKSTKDIEKILGYKSVDEVIHRDNLVLL